jgi:hypothetical protein
MLISLLEHSQDASLSRYSPLSPSLIDSFVDEKILPVLRSVGGRWPGRGRYLAWFLSRGMWKASPWRPALAAQAATALFPDNAALRTLLRRYAEHGVEPAVQAAAVQALATGWADHPDTRPLLERVAADPHWSVRAAAMQALAAGWADYPDTRPLLERVAADRHESVRAARCRPWPPAGPTTPTHAS